MWRKLLYSFALAAALSAPQAWAEDGAMPAQWLTTAKSLADAAPDALFRRTLGQVALPTYGTAKFRNVRGHYMEQELVNDQVVFCGEIDAVIPSTGQRSGWTKFVYLPGDPTTLMSDTPGLGTREIGPQVRKQLCDRPAARWFAEDFTPSFQRMPKSLADSSQSR